VIVVIVAGVTAPWLTSTTPTTTTELMLTGITRVTDDTGAASSWYPPILVLLIIPAVFAGRSLEANGRRLDRRPALRGAITGAALIAIVGGAYYCRRGLIAGPDSRFPSDATATLGPGAIATGIVGTALLVYCVILLHKTTVNDNLRNDPFIRPRLLLVEKALFGAFLAAVAAVIAFTPMIEFTVDGIRVAAAGFDGLIVGEGHLPDGTSADAVFTGWWAMSLPLIALALGLAVTMVSPSVFSDVRALGGPAGTVRWGVAGSAILLFSIVGGTLVPLRWSPDKEKVGIEFSSAAGTGVWALSGISVAMLCIAVLTHTVPVKLALCATPTNDFAPGVAFSENEMKAARMVALGASDALDSDSYFYRGANVSSSHAPAVELVAIRWAFADLAAGNPDLASAVDRFGSLAVITAMLGAESAGNPSRFTTSERTAIDDANPRAIIRILELSGIGTMPATPQAAGDASIVNQIVLPAEDSPAPFDSLPSVIDPTTTPAVGSDSDALAMNAIIDAINGRQVRATWLSVRVDGEPEPNTETFLAIAHTAYDRYTALGFGRISFEEWFSTPEFRALERPSTQFSTRTDFVKFWEPFRSTLGTASSPTETL